MIVNFEDIIGKTIKEINQRNHSKYDDKGYLDITFTDDTGVTLVGGYTEDWSGKSINEYPTKIEIKYFGYEEQ